MRAGETPIPCVRCNEKVKFADLLDTARELGAEALATGHYVRRVEGAGGAELHAAADHAPRPELFPVRHHTGAARLSALSAGRHGKDARCAPSPPNWGWSMPPSPTARTSVLCRKAATPTIVNKLRPDAARPGEIVDQSGAVLGRHDGIVHFTVGQRKGLGLSGNEEPLFVLKLDAANARVVVGPRAALASSAILLQGGELAGADAAFGRRSIARVKVRSMRPPVAAQVTPLAGRRGRVELLAPEDAIAPGQACVFYEAAGSRVLGGGWIAEPAAATA